VDERALVPLADAEALRQLKARYFRLLDTKRWDAWRTLFTEDVLTSRGADRDIFVEGVVPWLDGITTVHQGHGPVLRSTGPVTAAGAWPMFDFNENLAAPRERLGKQGYGHYVEEYRRDAGRWRIAATRITRLRQDSLEGPPLELGRNLARLDPAWLPEDPPAPPPPEQLVELEALRQLKARACRLLDTERPGETVHQAHMPDLQLTGDTTARGIWLVTELVEGEGVAYGHHCDDYAKVGGEWRLVSQRKSYLRIDPPPPLLGPTAASTPSPDWLAGTDPPDPERLVDVAAIEQLRACFVDAFDGKRGDELQALSTGDHVVHRPAPNWTTVHHTHTRELGFAGPDEARGIWSIASYVEAGGRAERDGARGHGYCEESYRREGGEWRIASSQVRWLRYDVLSGPPVRPYTGWSYQLPASAAT
jgi:hypothetical protein